jgi:5-methylcytosine-specific restriction protein A
VPRAPRRCPGDNYECPNLITTERYCPDHTAPWQSARTNSSKISGKRIWRQQVVPFILKRDGYECQIATQGVCLGRATTVDKIIPAARRPDLAMDPGNLRAACQPCNALKGRTTDRQRAPRGRRR